MNLIIFLFVILRLYRSAVQEVILTSSGGGHGGDSTPTDTTSDALCEEEHTFCVGDCSHCNSTHIRDVIPFTVGGGYTVYLFGSSIQSTEHSEELDLDIEADEHHINTIEAYPGHTIIWKDESFYRLLTVTASWWKIHSGSGTLVLENLDRSVMKDFIIISHVEGFTLGPLLMNLRHSSVHMNNFIGIEVDDHEHQEIIINDVKFSYFDSSYVNHAISVTSTDEFQEASPLHEEQIHIKNCFFSSISHVSSLKVDGSPINVYIEGNYFTHTRHEFSPNSFIEVESGLPPDLVIQNNIFEVGTGDHVELEGNHVNFVYDNASAPANVTFMNNLLINPKSEIVGLEVTGPSTQGEVITIRVHNNIMTHPFNHCEPLLKTSYGLVSGSFGSNFRSWACPSWMEGISLDMEGQNEEFNDTKIFYESDEKPYPYYTIEVDTLLASLDFNPGHDYFFREKSQLTPTAGPFEKLCSFFCGYSITATASRGLCMPGDTVWGDFHCQCSNGYTGPRCTCLPKIQNYSSSGHGCVCLNHGDTHFVINHDGECECEEGYEGDDCDDPICFGHPASDHHGACGGDEQGHCVEPDECECLDDYIGEECDRVWGVSQKIGLGFVCLFIFMSMLVCLCVVCVDSTLFVVVRKIEGRPIIDYKGFSDKMKEKLEDGKKAKEENGCCTSCFGGGGKDDEDEDEDEDQLGDGQEDQMGDPEKLEYVGEPNEEGKGEEDEGVNSKEDDKSSEDDEDGEEEELSDSDEEKKEEGDDDDQPSPRVIEIEVADDKDVDGDTSSSSSSSDNE